MDLSMASVFFDKDPLYDAYTGDYLYDGQFATYEGNQLDGSFIRRRTVSLSPELALPARRVVTLYGEQWVLSDPIHDGFYGEPVRQTMSARKCHALYAVQSAAELAEGLTTREAYAFSRWVKNTADAATTQLGPYFEFSFSITEQSVDRKFIVDGTKVWHARMCTQVSEGFLFAEADELISDSGQGARVQVEVLGELDPKTLIRGQGHTANAVMFSRYQFYTKTDQAQDSNYHGDMTLVIAKASVSAKQPTLRIGSEEWATLAVEDLDDGLALHIRRVV